MSAAVALSLLAATGAGIAQTTTTQTTTTRTTTLSPEERTTFREYVVREQRPSVIIDNIEVRPGTVLPPTVQFYTVPQVPTYQYGYVNNRYVVVEPQTRRVIEVIQ
ncbi:MAG: DUF1236 domain-containing protein [Alphaproteobacteria bacterium]|nr:DUF1236 domain-containing protein [Alphaproteobacteria bacterium]